MKTLIQKIVHRVYRCFHFKQKPIVFCGELEPIASGPYIVLLGQRSFNRVSEADLW